MRRRGLWDRLKVSETLPQLLCPRCSIQITKALQPLPSESTFAAENRGSSMCLLAEGSRL